jgi:hypothetical protein
MAVFVWATGAIPTTLGLGAGAIFTFSVNNRQLTPAACGAIIYNHATSPKTPVSSRSFTVPANSASIISLTGPLLGLTYFELEVRLPSQHMDVFSNDLGTLVGGTLSTYAPGSWFRDSNATDNP